jgi:hypothetical protein
MTEPEHPERAHAQRPQPERPRSERPERQRSERPERPRRAIRPPHATGIGIGIGILAGWLAALLGLSFYARRRIGAQRWRRAHRWTVLVWAMSAVHTLTAGTDASTPWMRAILVVTTLPSRSPSARGSPGHGASAAPCRRLSAPEGFRSVHA